MGVNSYTNRNLCKNLHYLLQIATAISKHTIAAAALPRAIDKPMIIVSCSSFSPSVNKIIVGPIEPISASSPLFVIDSFVSV